MPNPGVLELRLFDGLDVLFDGQRLDFPTRHSALILAILALEPQMRLSRERLAHVLWDTRGEAQSRASLRQALYHARRTLTEAQAPELITDHGHVALPIGVQSDVARFMADLDDDPLAAANDFGGAILPGISGFGPAFDDWLQEVRRSVEARAQIGFHKALTDDEMPASSRLSLAEALLRIDRFDEAALRYAMRAHADLDRRGAAIQLFEETRAALLAELGLEPDEETQSLADAVSSEVSAAVDPDPDGTATSIGSRRSVSALFLVAEVPEDPEDFGDEMDAFANSIRLRLEGEADVIRSGPAVACIFGLGRPTERHTEIALRAFLSLIDDAFSASAAIVTGELVVGDGDATPDLAHLLAPAMLLAQRAGPGKVMLSPEAAQRIGNLPPEVIAHAASTVIGLPATAPRSAPFTGRQTELAMLEEAFSQVGSTGGRLVSIVGEAGMGKTTLVRQFLETCVPATTSVLRIQAAEAATSRPFAVLGDLFAGVSDVPDIVIHMLGKGRKDAAWNEVPAAVRRRKLADAVLERIRGATQETPAVLVMEDLHWIDPETDTLLQGVINHLSNLPLLIVATHRPEYRGGWVGRSFFRLLQLAPMAEPDARRLLADLIPQTEKARQDELLRRAAGVPYFIVELARSQTDQKPNSRFPSSIRDVLSAHLMRLPGPQLRLLQVASVLGPEFHEDRLRQMEHSLDSFDDLMVTLIGEEHLIPLPGACERRYRFKHALLHEAAYASILRDERRKLHARALAALKQSASGPEGGSAEAEMAEHAWRAQAWRDAAKLFVRIGDRYAELSSYSLAREAYERARHALDAAPEQDGHLAARLDLALRLRPVLVPLGAYEEARAELSTAETLASSMDDHKHLSKVLIGKSYLFSTHGRLPEAAETAQRAIELTEKSSQLYHEAHLALGQALSLAADWRGTEAALLPSLAFWDAHPHERFGHTGTRAIWCYGMLANARTRKGDKHLAETYACRALDLAHETARPLDQVFALQRVADAKRLAGWTSEVLELLEDSFRRAKDVDAPIFQVWFACDLAAGYTAMGRLDDAHNLLNRQLHIAEKLQLLQFKAWIDLRRGELACLEGDFETATSLLNATLSTAEAIGDRALEIACHKTLAGTRLHHPSRESSAGTVEHLLEKYDLFAVD